MNQKLVRLSCLRARWLKSKISQCVSQFVSFKRYERQLVSFPRYKKQSSQQSSKESSNFVNETRPRESHFTIIPHLFCANILNIFYLDVTIVCVKKIVKNWSTFSKKKKSSTFSITFFFYLFSLSSQVNVVKALYENEVCLMLCYTWGDIKAKILIVWQIRNVEIYKA